VAGRPPLYPPPTCARQAPRDSPRARPPTRSRRRIRTGSSGCRRGLTLPLPQPGPISHPRAPHDRPRPSSGGDHRSTSVSPRRPAAVRRLRSRPLRASTSTSPTLASSTGTKPAKVGAHHAGSAPRCLAHRSSRIAPHRRPPGTCRARRASSGDENRPAFPLVGALVEPPGGIEPPTPSLPWMCSAD
jgi:hypothetical protein